MVKMLKPRLATASTGIARVPPKKADSFYLSPAWRALVDDVKAERGEACEDPEHDPTRPRRCRCIGDHIVELRDGGAALDRRNVMLRCWPCHGRKTERERRRRMEAAAANARAAALAAPRGAVDSPEGAGGANRPGSHAEIFSGSAGPRDSAT